MIEMNKKYIFVTGGVVSGLGKGITAAGPVYKRRSGNNESFPAWRGICD